MKYDKPGFKFGPPRSGGRAGAGSRDIHGPSGRGGPLGAMRAVLLLLLVVALCVPVAMRSVPKSLHSIRGHLGKDHYDAVQRLVKDGGKCTLAFPGDREGRRRAADALSEHLSFIKVKKVDVDGVKSLKLKVRSGDKKSAEEVRQGGSGPMETRTSGEPGEPRPGDSPESHAKYVRSLSKKWSQIMELVARQKAGGILGPAQMQKIARRVEVRNQIQRAVQMAREAGWEGELPPVPPSVDSGRHIKPQDLESNWEIMKQIAKQVERKRQEKLRSRKKRKACAPPDEKATEAPSPLPEVWEWLDDTTFGPRGAAAQEGQGRRAKGAAEPQAEADAVVSAEAGSSAEGEGGAQMPEGSAEASGAGAATPQERCERCRKNKKGATWCTAKGHLSREARRARSASPEFAGAGDTPRAAAAGSEGRSAAGDSAAARCDPPPRGRSGHAASLTPY